MKMKSHTGFAMVWFKNRKILVSRFTSWCIIFFNFNPDYPDHSFLEYHMSLANNEPQVIFDSIFTGIL